MSAKPITWLGMAVPIHSIPKIYVLYVGMFRDWIKDIFFYSVSVRWIDDFELIIADPFEDNYLQLVGFGRALRTPVFLAH